MLERFADRFGWIFCGVSFDGLFLRRGWFGLVEAAKTVAVPSELLAYSVVDFIFES